MRLLTVGLLICATAASAQEAVDTKDDALRLVRELRAEAAQRLPEYRSIDVYARYFRIGSQRFESLDELLQYIEVRPPGRFNRFGLGDCRDRARLDELLSRMAELDRPRRPSVIGLGRIDAGKSDRCIG